MTALLVRYTPSSVTPPSSDTPSSTPSSDIPPRQFHPQGATLAALFLLLAAPTPDSPPPVRCAILVAGFLPRDASVLEQLEARASVHPPLAVPTLHVAGETDGFVPIESTRALAAAFEHPVLFLHPGGHGIPTGAGFRAAVVEFLASVPDD